MLPLQRCIQSGYTKENSMVQKASPKLTEMMNQAIAGELQAIVQYMWHHIMV